MSKVEKQLDYKLISFFHKKLYRLSKRFNEAARELNFLKYKMRFGEREDDIYVISYPKSGTTMLQMILYQLTTDGEMNFKHIDDVAPWIKNEAFENRKPKELDSPRIIKSHDTYKTFEHTKGRFIFIMRDGRDVAVSKYHQDKNYNNPKLEFDKFLKDFFYNKQYNWFTYHKDWIQNKHKRKILYLTYEEVKNEKEKVLKKIATFCKLKIDAPVLDRTLERSAFDFMKVHEGKFGIRPKETEKVYDQFIRKGKSGGFKEYFSEEQLSTFHEKYTSVVKPVISSKHN